MPLTRSWIESHVPHAGKMCLLDEVLDWDAAGARCRSATHRSPDNPLRAYGRLGAACGIEYAAQTMAVHGALLAAAGNSAAPPAMLASVRNVELLVERLDTIEGDLIASVEQVAGDMRSALYEFSLSSDAGVLLTGRAAIAFTQWNLS